MPDHPRTRGVYARERVSANDLSGSSPHTRGLLLDHGPRRIIPRIIPAHAGFTRGEGWKLRFPPDHPRTRGVYSE